tara:strand:+ start:1307 stop:1708 length:402 start_codon:yes stop_codon:yes gene_type:complete
MNLINLLEEWKATTRKTTVSGERDFDIFVNPSKKELRELVQVGSIGSYKQARFIADYEKEKIYVFSAELTHVHAANELKIPYDSGESNEKFHFGWGDINTKTGKVVFSLGVGTAEKKRLIRQEWIKKYLEFDR